MQFRVIMVTDPQTNKHTHKPTDRTDYIALQRSFASMQCNDSGDSVVIAVTVMLMCVSMSGSINEAEFARRLWGDMYFNNKTYCLSFVVFTMPHGHCLSLHYSHYNDEQYSCSIFRLDALALSVIATATWLAGWLSHSCIVSKRLNLSENFFDHLKAPSF